MTVLWALFLLHAGQTTSGVHLGWVSAPATTATEREPRRAEALGVSGVA